MKVIVWILFKRGLTYTFVTEILASFLRLNSVKSTECQLLFTMSSPADYSASRKRTTLRQHSAEDQALSQVAKEAESRLAARRAARAEARDIRSRELERQQREQEDREKDDRVNDVKREFSNSRYVSSANSSRRGSDASTDDTRDVRKELSELEEKYKRSMMTNAQLDNEKQAFRYQVDLLKDQVDEMEEQLIDAQRELKDRVRELELKKRDFTELDQKCRGLTEQLEQRDALIQEHGLVFVSDDMMMTEDETDAASAVPDKKPLITSTSAALLSSESIAAIERHSGTLDERLRKIADEKKVLEKEVRKLKQELEDERERRSVVDKYKSHSPTPNTLSNGPTESQSLDVQADMLRQINDYKFKLKRAEQDITTLEGNVIRLESQVKRFKTAADNAEKVEEELKAEKRRFQKELREVQSQKQELELENGHLQKRLEKLQKVRPNIK